MREEVLQKLIDRTAETLKVEATTLNESTKIQDLGLKSLELVGIISTFEEEYDVYVKYTEFMHAQTIGESVDILVKIIEG